MDVGAMPFMVPIVAIVCTFVMICIVTVAESVRKASDRKHIEESRREIAAYVAEGTISPDDAERLIAAKPDHKKKGKG